MSKVSIIGAGEVGAPCATCLAERDFVNEITIIDIKHGLAEGKALDLRQSAEIKQFAVIYDQRRVFPACAYLNGEYGCKDIYLGVPVVIGKNGIERVIELELDPDDKERFELSHQTVRASLSLIHS